MRILGIDYGKRKIGLAISEGISASPLKVLEVGSLSDAVAKITNVIEKEAIDKIVIGIAETGEAKSMTEKFISSIRGKIEIIEVEETLSSKNASQQMISLGKTKKSRENDDAYAAANLLQEYLDANRDNE